MKKKSVLKKVVMIGLILIITFVLMIFIINWYVKASTSNQIIENDDYSNLNDIDCILVLGAGVWGNSPSPMLEDRLLEGIKLYQSGVANKIIMTGDHGRKEYDEVNVMKDFAIDKGVPSEDIFMDHAGFSTYESIYRARDIFEAKKVIIVTQKYHLYRALYIANQLGIEAYGVGADPREYVGQSMRELREILARNKDFVKCIFKPEPTYLGDVIPVSGNGNLTNDKVPNDNETIEVKGSVITMNNEVTHVTMEDIEQIMKDNENFIILDVRTLEEYNEGHIPNAICIPNETIGDEEIAELPDKEQLLLVYCRSGRRSKEASEKLLKLGYTNIIEFGGIIDWKGEIER